MKYSPPSPQVEVDAQPAGAGQLEIRVRDTGIGIERAHLKRIFKRFHRVPRPAVHERSGTGLGLSTVYGIVRQTGGAISVVSDRGQGASFRVYLPAISGETP